MRNLLFAFVIGFFTHLLISKYYFTSSSNVLDGVDGKLNLSNSNPDQPVTIQGSDSEHLNSKKILKQSANENNNLDLSNCPTLNQLENSNKNSNSLNRTSKKNNILINKFETLIADRKLLNMDLNDLKQMSDTSISDPALILARSNQIQKYEDLKSLNGVYEGYLNTIDGSGELKSIEAYMEIDFSSNNNNAVGKYLLELKGRGTSSGNGTPNSFKKNPNTSDFFIQFGPDYYLQVTDLDQYFRANYYKNNELAGFAKLKRIR